MSLTLSSTENLLNTTLNCGINWTARTAPAGNNYWNSVTYGNGLFVAVASPGSFPATNYRVMTSPDGITWTSRTGAELNLWVSVTYGNGVFVAVSPNTVHNAGPNLVMTSTNGINWTARTAAEQNYWNSVTYGDGKFVAVAQDGTNRVMTSTDGITWTARTAAQQNQWSSVTYGNGLFVAVAQTGTNQVMTSPDGITWTARTAALQTQWGSVTYGNGLFVAVSLLSQVMTSPDGINWTARTAGAVSNWRCVTYGNGLFVAVSGDTGLNQRVMTSPDGINWTGRNAPEQNQWFSVTYGDGKFVAVAINGISRVMTSDCNSSTVVTPTPTPTLTPTLTPTPTLTQPPCEAGSSNWRQITVPNLAYLSITYGNGLFVAVAFENQTNCIVTSSDGITWTRRIAPTALWRGVVYGNGLFVATSSDSNLMMTSTDGITWIQRTPPRSPSEIIFANGRFVGYTSFGSGTTPRIITSTDGINWTNSNNPTTGYDPMDIWNAIGYVNGLYVILASGRQGGSSGSSITYTSPDGINWTVRNSGIVGAWGDIASTDGLIVAVSNAGIMVSTNGINWTLATPPVAGVWWRSVTYGNGRFVALNFSSTINTIAVSTDGINWTGRNSPIIGDWRSVTYGNGKFIAVSNGGSGIMSDCSGGLPTPTPTSTVTPTNTPTDPKVTATPTPTETYCKCVPVVSPTISPSPTRTPTGTPTPTVTPTLTGTVYSVCVNGAGFSEINGIYNSFQGTTLLKALPNGTTVSIQKLTSSVAPYWIFQPSWSSRVYINNGGQNSILPPQDGWILASNTASTLYSPAPIISYGDCPTPTPTPSKSACPCLITPTPTPPTQSPTPTPTPTRVGVANTLYSADFIPLNVTVENNAYKINQIGTNNPTLTCFRGTNYDFTINSSNLSTSWNFVSAGEYILNDVTYANGLFVAVGAQSVNSQTVAVILTSPDGVTWTKRTSDSFGIMLFSITYGNGLFVAVGGLNTLTQTRYMTSPDGINWTYRTAAAIPIRTWSSVAFGNGMFVAVTTPTNGGTNTQLIMTSPDGINWTLRDSPVANGNLHSIIYANGLFVVYDYNFTRPIPSVLTSPNGINWTSRNGADGVYVYKNIAANDSGLIVVGNSQYSVPSGRLNRLARSTDGISWVGMSGLDANASDHQIQSWNVGFGGGRFISIPVTATTQFTVLTGMQSANGIDWSVMLVPTIQKAPTEFNDGKRATIYGGIAYGNGRFVVVGSSGTHRVMYSDDVTNNPSSTHPLALRASSLDTSTEISGTFNNNIANGRSNGEVIFFTPNDTTPSSIVYQSTTQPSISGLIEIKNY